MRKLFFYFLFLTKITTAQLSSVDIYYGYKTLKNNYHNQLNTFQSFDANKSISFFGLAVSENGLLGIHEYYLQLSGHVFMPEKITIADTIHLKLSGFNFGYNLGLNLLRKRETVALTIIAGFNTGLLRLANSDFKQTNPFFAPKLGLSPVIRVKNLVFSFVAEYDFDISGTHWKNTKGQSPAVSRSFLNQSGLNTRVGIGYSLQ